MGNYIRAASLGGFEELVRSYEINPIDILKQVGILPSIIREPNSFIDYDRYLNLLNQAAIACNEECFGLKLGARQNIRTIGLIGIYMSRQNTILEALNVAQKYVYLHAEGLIFHVNQLPNQLCELNLVRLNQQNTEMPQKAQLTIGLIQNILKDLIGSTWKPERIKLKQRPLEMNQQLFSEILNCEVEFNANQDAIYFSTEFLDYKPSCFNEDMINQLIEQQLESQNNKPVHDDEILIESSVKILLATGDCSIDNIALCMGVHPKKLQRQLKQRGTTYRDLLEHIRKKEAIRIMNSSSITLTDLALQLGYAELSIFSRRFKNWFGITPTEWKEKAKQLT